MGTCLCKDEIENGLENELISANSSIQRGCGNSKYLSETVDKLVNETLEVIGTIIDNDPDPPNSILMLQMITDKASGWMELIHSLTRVVPTEHPMGPSVIALLLDDSPIPSNESLMRVSEMINYYVGNDVQRERNLCVILGCLAEKLAGPNSITLLNKSTQNYLISNLCKHKDLNVQLLSLIALEKFAQTSENKATLKKIFENMDPNPLLELEKNTTASDYRLQQIVFCARWCLDNYFPVKERSYSYETLDLSKINAMLNPKDVSEHLKISPDGLEARCDSYTFESARCTFPVESGCYYYEVLLVTPGVMQIGWATKESNFRSDDGYGIGDDKFSIGFDGYRKLIWYNAKSIPHNLPVWKSGSILGCLLDIERMEIIFSLDGERTNPYRHIFKNVCNGFFAAASFMSFQQCHFNFGLEPFKFPPSRPYKSFNEEGYLQMQDKIILPRHIYLDLMRKVSVCDDSCTICYDNKADIILKPCGHRGFCVKCVEQLTSCPMCRAEINNKLHETVQKQL